jgi:hypothetical protein
VLTALDCNDADASSTTRATDGDCDGAVTALDCNDASASSATRATDGDCDGVPTALDCNDTNAGSTTRNIDGDCDGVLTALDCNDANPDSTTRASDLDCDAVLTADDCNDASATFGARSGDGDCDGTPALVDCDDGNASSTTRATDGDCDGVLTAADCNDANAVSTTKATDADCDGVLTAADCNDADAASTTKATDADCDGVLTDADCSDANASLGAKVADVDCDGVLFAADCNDADPLFGALANDLDCDGVPTAADCDDNDNQLGAQVNDGDCDGVLLGVDCNDANAAVTTQEPNCIGFRAVAVGPVTVAEDTTTTVTLSTAGGDGSTVTWQAVGTLAGATISVAGDVLTYRGPANVGGVDDTITLTPQQQGAAGVPTTLTVHITAVNDLPSFVVADPLVTTEDVDLLDVALATATSAGPLEAQLTTVTVDFATAASIVADVVDVAGDGSSFAIFLVPDASGTGVLNVTVTDNGTPALSVTQQVQLTVNAFNDPPRLTPAAVTVAEDATLVGVVLATGVVPGPPDERGIVELVGITAGPGASLVAASPALTGALAGGTITVSAGALNPDANGAQTLTITIGEKSGNDTVNVASYDVTLNVTPVNDPPRLTGTSLVFDEDASLLGRNFVTAVAAGPANETETVTLSVAPGGGTDLVDLATLVLDATGVVTAGTLRADRNGTGTLTVTATDAFGATATVSITLRVNAVDDPPVLLRPLVFAIPAGAGTKTFPLTFSDVDGGTFTVDVGPSPSFVGVAATTTTLTLSSPDLAQTGRANFRLTLTSSDGTTATQTVSVAALGPQASCFHYRAQNGLLPSNNGDGVYALLQPSGGGAGCTTQGGCLYAAHCDMSADGGGWTLVMKASGNSDAWVYDAGLWSDTSTLAEDIATSAFLVVGPNSGRDGEAKLRSFNHVKVDDLRIGFAPTTTGSTAFRFVNDLGTPPNMPLGRPAAVASMRTLMGSGATRSDLSVPSRADWTALSTPAFSLQANCNRAGLNVRASGNSGNVDEVRIGILAGATDCARTDTYVGIGTTNSGNTAGALETNGDRPRYAAVLVRSYDLTDLGNFASCADVLAAGYADADAVYSVANQDSSCAPP